MIVAVTGGCGFLGRRVCHRLHQFGIDHIAIDNIDRLCGGDPNFPHADIDIRDRAGLSKFVLSYGVTDIIHLAAYGRNLTCQDFPRDAWDVNVTGTQNVLDVARVFHLNRVVVCSSNITLSHKTTVYKSTKTAAEELVKMYASLGVETLALRPANIYGPGQSRKEYQMCAFAGLDDSFLRTGRFKITGDGTQMRDWVHVDDVAQAFVQTLLLKKVNAHVWGLSFDVCTGIQTSLNDIADMLGVGVDYVEARPGDAATLISDLFPALTWLQWKSSRKLSDHVWEAFPAVMA